MDVTKCMIAGLPGSGKSTYIGALWYSLKHPAKDEDIKLVEDKTNLPDDISVLNRLRDSYREMTPIDRTNSNQNESVQINLKAVESGEKVQIEIPDFLGETFRDIVVLEESTLLNDWLKVTDTLLYLVSDVSIVEFEDDYRIEDDDRPLPDIDIEPFNPSDISSAAMNIMVLKYLLRKRKFKKVVIALTWWDKYTKNGTEKCNPETYLKEQSPALYNFIRFHLPNHEIIGLSAQGLEYPEINQEDYEKTKKEVKAKTREGKRSFVEIGDDIFHDLSLPLYLLLKNDN